MDVRGEYQKFGVKNFYQFHGKDYNNPHEESIRKSIRYVYKNCDIDFSRVLDLACGKGEITKILTKLGVKNIDAIDGYLCDLYTEETGKDCTTMTFDEIMHGKIKDKHYSVVICSFALHLLEPSKLPLFMWEMRNITDKFLILSPHKNPIIKDDWVWQLENEIYIDRVRTRFYSAS